MKRFSNLQSTITPKTISSVLIVKASKKKRAAPIVRFPSGGPLRCMSPAYLLTIVATGFIALSQVFTLLLSRAPNAKQNQTPNARSAKEGEK